MLPARIQLMRRFHIDSGVACPLWRGWQFLLRSFNWKSVSKEWPAWDALLWLGTLGLPIAKDRNNKLWVGCQLAIKFLVLCKTAKRLTRAIISRVYMVQYTWWFFNSSSGKWNNGNRHPEVPHIFGRIPRKPLGRWRLLRSCSVAVLLVGDFR